MRGLILALVFALVGAQKYDLEPGFRTGKTYLYDYEGLILHGLPGKGLAAAGLKLICRLEISRVSHSDHLLQIRSPKLEEYHGFWPGDAFTLSPKLTGTIAACFSQAFKFEYTEGKVGSIYAPENCPILCTNLVRGILNMMQITVKKSQNVYELQESGIEGICQTRYVIQDDSKNNRATISKSKDLTDCQDSVVQSTGMAYIRPCPTCPMKVRNMKGTVLFTYKMKYSDSGALMMSAMSEQMYQISPFNEPDGTAAVEARQKLVLVDIKSIPIKAPDAQLQNQGSLRYHFPEGLLQMPVPLIRIKNADVQLTETLQQLVQNNEEGGTTEASVKFLQMVQLLRVVTLDEIESVWVQFASEPPYRHWFMSAVCAAGATDTFQFLKQKIHDKNLNIWEAAVALPLAFHSVMPSKKTLEVASTFLTCPQIQKTPMLRVLVYLGYGSLVNKYCAQPSFCPNELLQPLHDLAAEASSRSHVEDIALALKAIGNAGEPASIKRIQKFLPTFSLAAAELPSRIHADAVLALRKIARKDPAKVREITLQIFMDSTLAPNVRMTACIVLFETKPSLPVVAAMASSLLTETSLQVASFTYSHMKALAVGGIPQLYNLSAACNIAIKLLSPRLDRLSYRYSKVIHAGGYSYVYKAGAIWRVYLMNSPNSMFPSDIITKVRGYYANTATDIVEIALRSQSLTNIIRKQNIPFAEYDTYKTLKELGKTLLGWKELPPEDPLLSAYIKVLGQEIAFIDIDSSIIQQAMKSLTGSSSWQPAVKRAVEEAQRGVSGRWALPAVVAELRHAVPTVLGLPLELSICGAALAQAAATVDMQMSPPLLDNFRPSQLLETNMDIHADVKPKVYFHMIAMMGTNTQYLQSGLELHAEFSANTTMKFDARINMKEKNVKIETLPCHQEVELAAVRSEAYAISRNMEEVDSEKKSPILPNGEMPTVSNQHFQSSEIFSRARSWEQRNIRSVISRGHLQGSEDEHHHGEGQRSYARVFCTKLASLGCSACLSLKSRNSAFLRNTCLNKLVGELEAKIVLLPVHTDADIEKIQLEIQAGAKAASKIIDATSSGPKEEKEPSLYENIKAKLKKILGIENVFKVANKTRRHKKWIHDKVKAAVTDLWEEPSASPLSSSSSTDSSAERKEPGNKHEKDEVWQFGKKHGSGSSSSTGSGSSKACSSSREDSSGDKLCSVNSEYFNQQADLPIYQFWFKPADEQDPPRKVQNSSISSSSSSSSDEGISVPVSQPVFLGDSRPPILAAVLRAIKRNEQPTGYQLVLYTDRQASRLRVQVFVSSITESNRWKLCADASVVNSHKASGTLKWGKDCQDYKVATQIATGQFAAHPAIQVKLEWSKVPSSVRKTARWLYTYFPGAAYMLGYSQKQQRGPSHQAAMVMALTSPRTCDVVLKLPELTVYNRAIRLPLPLPSSSDTPTSPFPSSDWNVFYQAAFSIIENLKARCSVSQNVITTFNGVEFNYSMPANCYHILAQDCSPELKFLVMIKRLEESTDLTAISVRLASHEVDMYVSNGLIQLKINGVQTPTDVPYTSKSGLLISSEKEGLSLKAPEYGVEKLYYDGHKLEIQVAFWMVGKTCGICGKYDAEKKREYQMPSGYLAKDAVSFAQSWVISEDVCTGACKLQRKFVKIEKPVAFDKKASKCFSIEPVLHCAEGCSATRTVPVSVGFHCVPSDSTLELEEEQARLDQKSEDLVSSVDAHTACSCAQQPCAA
ncbi:vitellogenin-2-like [Centrocercus urophasianus]|uniref:vitellogenin-2-like n=1 Tax=Centrocercus urophasianus TaxID=9002 RepID=UPI001C64A13F|nr:vitellogenin-2-like [Centrocercus urophasianus]